MMKKVPFFTEILKASLSKSIVMFFTNNLPNTLAYYAKERVLKFTSCIVSALAFSQISRYKFFNSLKLLQLQQTLLINLG